jgi:hypothetical protein
MCDTLTAVSVRKQSYDGVGKLLWNSFLLSIANFLHDLAQRFPLCFREKPLRRGFDCANGLLNGVFEIRVLCTLEIPECFSVVLTCFGEPGVRKSGLDLHYLLRRVSTSP